jgi:MerR family transcriptional regulator, heat shock protein HspR
MAKAKSKAAYMISAVSQQYEIHPQTLRLYEREGLLKPSRSEGNTRLYTAEDLERLEVILHLTRDLGVNLAGVEIILNMREKMGEMQAQIQEFIATLNRELAARSSPPRDPAEGHWLVPVINARRNR